MTDFSVAFKVVNERNCPLYQVEDFFVLTDQAVRLPAGHPACLVLIRELTGLLFAISPGAAAGFTEQQDEIYSCGGCTGLIKFRMADPAEDPLKEGSGGDLEREADSNMAVAREKRAGVGISGSLEEISPSELLQFFHMHQKTGKLLLHVSGGIGRVAFREGSIIGAKYGELEDKEAVFSLMGELQGRFSFQFGIPSTLMVVDAIGDFMMILMEGIKRLDEVKGQS